MKKLLLAGAAAVSLGISDPARAADMPLGNVAPVPIFNWTSCFLGAHIGGGWAHKDFTDPVALVQNSILGTVTPGVTTCVSIAKFAITVQSTVMALVV